MRIAINCKIDDESMLGDLAGTLTGPGNLLMAELLLRYSLG